MSRNLNDILGTFEKTRDELAQFQDETEAENQEDREAVQKAQARIDNRNKEQLRATKALKQIRKIVG